MINLMKQHWPFQIRSSVDLPHVCEASPCAAYRFRDYRNCFCLPLTYFLFNFGVFLMLHISHQRQWSPVSLPFDQPQILYPRTQTPSDSSRLGEPTSSFAGMHSPPFSHLVEFSRGQRIRGGLRGSD